MTNLFSINTGEGTKGKPGYYTTTPPQKNTSADKFATEYAQEPALCIEHDITGMTYKIMSTGEVKFEGFDY